MKSDRGRVGKKYGIWKREDLRINQRELEPKKIRAERDLGKTNTHTKKARKSDGGGKGEGTQ